MNTQRLLQRLKHQLKRACSLLMLFQRGGAATQALVPELNLAASAGALEAAKVVVASAVGLGAYDSVAGATTIGQVSPRTDRNLIYTVGSAGTATLSIQGTTHSASAWRINGATSFNGLTLQGNGRSATLSGTPSAASNSSVTITASDGSYSTSGTFTLIAGSPPNISSQPANRTITSGQSTTLSVTATASGSLSYQWYSVAADNVTRTLINNATASSYTTPGLSNTSRYNVTITNTVGGFGFSTTSNLATVTVEAAALQVSSSASPMAGLAQVAYNHNFTAVGGVQPYRWSLSSGSLPPGLSLQSNGQLSGTPTTAGDFSFVAQVTDSAAPSVSATQDVAVSIGLNIATAATLSTAKRDTPYTQQLVVYGAAGPGSWYVGGGSTLPPGLSLSDQGEISGTPTQPGNYTMTIFVETGDTPPVSASRSFVLPVLGFTLGNQLGDCLRDNPFAVDLNAVGGTGPYRFAVASGSSLPAGLVLNASSGLLSGTPTEAGNYNFTLEVSDSATPVGATASRQYSLNVQGPNWVLRDESNQGLPADSNVYFGATAPGGSLSRTLTLRNDGSATLAFSRLGADSLEFALGGLPAELAAGQSATLTLRFEPWQKANIFQRETVNVTVSDASNPAAAVTPPMMTLNLSAQCLNQAALSQTLSIVAPTNLYLGQAGVRVHAYSSLGLPVDLTCEGSAASLAGSQSAGYVLTPGQATGFVTLKATQLGTARVMPARLTTLRVNVLAAPTKPTLGSLSHLYDGQNKTAEVLGLAQGSAAVITHMQGSTIVDEPREPGSYSVTATITQPGVATPLSLKGVMVIRQAPLWVQATSVQRRAMQTNPRLGYSLRNAANLPVLDADAAWTSRTPTSANPATQNAPVASCSATPLSPAGNYPINLSKGISSRYLPIALPGLLTVEGFGSNHEALISDSQAPHLPLGLLKVSCTSIRNLGTTLAPELRLSYSASLQSDLNPSTAALSFTGSLALDPSGEFVSTSNNAPTKAGPYLKSLTLRRDGNLSGVLAHLAQLGAAETLHPFEGSRLLESTENSASHQGQHSLTLGPVSWVSDAATPSGNTAPAGYGYANASIDRNGNMRISGTLNDGSLITASLRCDVQAQPGYRLFVFHRNRLGCTLAGEFSMTPAPNPLALPTLFGRRMANANLVLRKTAASTDTSYSAGYLPLQCGMEIRPWLTPNLTTQSLANLLGIGRADLDSLKFTHQDLSNADAATPPSRGISLDAISGKFSPSDGQSKTWSLNLVPATGMISGSVTQGLVTRTFRGILRLPASNTEAVIAVGQFNRINTPTNSKYITGSIQLERAVLPPP